MKSRVRRVTLFALYQLCLVAGIAMMPLAIAARQAGVTLPIHRLIAGVGEAYENAQ
ncbi:MULTISPECIES: hypothetical protein [Saliphagus]|uniref:Uncharacterized protein n=1 Tax=Saliphagus infecundisoli TaxID=1849069 RepID=A0ABD5QGI6_9EURY|nr:MULTISPECIES: hypothetical protein [Saliphagus]